MAHVEKYARSATGHMLDHYGRTEDDGVKRSNTDIDRGRTADNYNLAPEHDGGQMAFLQKRLSEVRVQNRKDVNVLCDWVLTLPQDVAFHEQESFFRAAYDFMADRYGRENVVSAYVHMDEKTPHMHFAFVPVTEDKKRGGFKVSAKEILTRHDLQTFHTDLQENLEQALGHSVGVLNGETKDGNRTVAELKRDTALERAAMAEQAAEKAADQLAEIRMTLESERKEVEKIKEERNEVKNDLAEARKTLKSVQKEIEEGNIHLADEKEVNEAIKAVNKAVNNCMNMNKELPRRGQTWGEELPPWLEVQKTLLGDFKGYFIPAEKADRFWKLVQRFDDMTRKRRTDRGELAAPIEQLRDDALKALKEAYLTANGRELKDVQKELAQYKSKVQQLGRELKETERQALSAEKENKRLKSYMDSVRYGDGSSVLDAFNDEQQRQVKRQHDSR